MDNKSKDNTCIKDKNAKKTATDNQWVTTGLDHYPDNRDRRDGPGGEDKDC